MTIIDDLRSHSFTPAPARATMKRMMQSPAFAAELKLDGVRQVLANLGGVITLTGRRDSKGTGLKLNKIGHCPHLEFFMQHYQETVFDGELCYPYGDSNDAVSIMGSKQELAVDKQRERGWLDYVVFDLLVLDGEVLTDRPYHQRRLMLLDALHKLDTVGSTIWMNMEYGDTRHLIRPVTVVGTCYDTNADVRDAFVQSMFNRVVNDGHEGLILKNVEGLYSHLEWAKVKPTVTYDFVICGYEPSSSETFEGTGIAALKLGLFSSDGKLLEITRCSGMTHEWRREFYVDYLQPESKRIYVGQVVSVVAQQMFDTGALRHPRFVGLRPEAEPRHQTFAKYRIAEV